jgi:asparagine synthase (glutamine-hydrolysing)
MKFNGHDSSARCVEKMTDALQMRGPDAQGIFVQGAVALGHRRLKIIDLSERAQQPMIDNQLGLSIIFNGAVYNYEALRRSLEAKGYRFFSTGDTEVILKSFHAWGRDCVRRLNGMFAFAIYERDSGRVFLARDRLGIKPLYYLQNTDELRFASSLPALIAGGGVKGEIDPVALHHYMTFHSVVPAPRTILRTVRKLPPGETMTIDPRGEIERESYWTLDFGPRPEERGYDLAEWKVRVRQALRQAVKRRLTADVPVGVLLSGGVDSSLVVGLLAELGQTDLTTFSIGFDAVNGEEGNEFRYSDRVAEHFATRHHRIEARAEDVLSAIDDCISAMSEPMVSHDCIGFYLLSRAVARHVKVVQSGQGADEIFGGYHWYPPLMTSSAPLYDYIGHFFDRSHTEYAAAVGPRFLEKDYSVEFVQNHFKAAGAPAAIDKALRIDTTVMLVEDPVKRVDNMTMAWGLEARVPFLDHEVVELAARIPAQFKVAGGGKHVLKEAARGIIPAEVIDRPKGYFPVPALKHLQGDYLAFVREALLSARSRERALFNPQYVNRLLAEPEKHFTPLRGSKIWQMAVLSYWLSAQGL